MRKSKKQIAHNPESGVSKNIGHETSTSDSIVALEDLDQDQQGETGNHDSCGGRDYGHGLCEHVVPRSQPQNYLPSEHPQTLLINNKPNSPALEFQADFSSFLSQGSLGGNKPMNI